MIVMGSCMDRKIWDQINPFKGSPTNSTAAAPPTRVMTTPMREWLSLMS